MKKIKEILTRNISLKILSFLLAALLWVSIMSFNDPYITKTIKDIKVNVINNNALGDKVYEIESGEYISIRVRGKRSVIDTLKSSDFNTIADFTQLSFVNAVPIQVLINNNEINYTDRDIDIQNRYPEMMTLTLEDLIDEIMNVDVVTYGEVKEGYYIAGSITTTKSMIQVKSTKKQLDKIAKISLNVDVSGADKTFKTMVVPVAYDENNDIIDSTNIIYEVPDMQVEVTILPTKHISIGVTQQGEPYDGYVCSELQIPPSALTVTIAATEEELGEISSYLVIPIDITQLTESTDMEINIEDILKHQFPDKNFIVIGDKVLRIRAKIEKLEVKDIMIKAASIEFKNLSKDYTARIRLDVEVRVRVKGLSEVLEGVTAESLKPYIDMQGKEAGTHFLLVLCDTMAKVDINSPTAVVEVYNK